MTTLKFTGHIPSKKNSKIKTRFGAIVPSKAYQMWHKEQMATLAGSVRIPSPVSIEYRFWIGGKAVPARFDLSNAIESINDLLVDAGILEDDSFDCVCSSRAEVMGFIRGEQIVQVVLTHVEHHWFEPLRILKDKEAIVAMATNQGVSQKRIIDSLWEKLTEVNY